MVPNGAAQSQFQTIAPTPPLPYRDDQFDIIYCISVFTHFDEEMQDLWLHELTRVLNPTECCC